MFHLWFIPLLLLLALAVSGFYFLVKYRGGTGVRTQGRTLVDDQQEETEPPPE